MPFRGGTAVREKLIQIQITLTARTRSKGQESRHKWTPGLVFGGPLPGQPWWLYNVDVIFVANLLYVLGSILYVVQALYFVHSFHLSSYDDDYNPNDPSNYLNLGGAALFIANALASFLDWHLCTKTASIMNAEVDVIPSPTVAKTASIINAEVDVIPSPTVAKTASIINAEVDVIPSPTVENSSTVLVPVSSMSNHLLLLYFWNNLLFLFAAIVFQIQGVWLFNVSLDRYGCMHSVCGDFALPLLGNLLYLASSLFSVAEFFESYSLRCKSSMCTTKMFPGCRSSLADVDWFAWGDWLYLGAALIPCVQSFWSFYYPWASADDENRLISPYYLFNQLVWLADSLAYMLGYYYFMMRVVAAANNSSTVPCSSKLVVAETSENPIVSCAEKFCEDDL